MRDVYFVVINNTMLLVFGRQHSQQFVVNNVELHLLRSAINCRPCDTKSKALCVHRLIGSTLSFSRIINFKSYLSEYNRRR